MINEAPKEALKQLVKNGNLIGNSNAQWVDKPSARFRTITTYIKHSQRVKATQMNSEFLYYMKSIIAKHTKRKTPDSIMYIKVSMIAKKINLGVINNEEQLINFIRHNEKGR